MIEASRYLCCTSFLSLSLSRLAEVRRLAETFTRYVREIAEGLHESPRRKLEKERERKGRQKEK